MYVCFWFLSSRFQTIENIRITWKTYYNADSRDTPPGIWILSRSRVGSRTGIFYSTHSKYFWTTLQRYVRTRLLQIGVSTWALSMARKGGRDRNKSLGSGFLKLVRFTKKNRKICKLNLKPSKELGFGTVKKRNANYLNKKKVNFWMYYE